MTRPFFFLLFVIWGKFEPQDPDLQSNLTKRAPNQSRAVGLTIFDSFVSLSLPIASLLTGALVRSCGLNGLHMHHLTP